MKLRAVVLSLLLPVSLVAPVQAIEEPKEAGQDHENTIESSDHSFILPEIPIQVPLGNEEPYALYREKASTYLSGNYSSECAKFVNRMFYLRFGKLMFGNAWDLQIKNKEFLDLVWQIPEDSFTEDLNLKKLSDRVEHFKALYSVLEKEEYPMGVLGFVYRYSFYREYVGGLENRISQTHVTFLAGRKTFYFENTFDHPKSLEALLVDKYGVIHDIERAFIENKVSLDQVLEPGERVYYDDYLVEEQFKYVQAASLLEVYLRKHRNNRVSSLLRPVSYSRIAQPIIDDLEKQKNILHTLGSDLEYVSGKVFDDYFVSEFEKENWKNILLLNLGIHFPEKSLIVPVPRLLIGKIQ